MRKMILMFISLVFTYIFIQLLILFFNDGYKVEYEIIDKSNTFKVMEAKNKKGKDNFYFEIKINDSIFPYQTFSKLNGKKQIKEIKYYKDDNYECILPVFNKKTIIFDITCKTKGNIVYYHNIVNKPKSLQDFAFSLDIYNEKQFIDTSTNITKKDIYTILVDNLIKNHYVSITNYQGIININKKNINEINIFSSDKYIRPLSTFIGNYYITADYNENYEFTKFYIANIKNNTLKELKDYYNISFDSYIMGSLKNKLYLFDLDNKVQYEIDLKNMSISKIGNIKKGIKIFLNNTWSNIEASKVIKNKPLFENNNRNILKDGTVIDTIGDKNYGFIYTYIKNNDKYLLYKSNIQNKNIKNYLFEIDNIDSVIYVDDYIYFKDGSSIYYYNEEIGKRKIIESNELLFNNQILYNVTK